MSVAEGPFPPWSPVRFLRAGDAQLVRCHTCCAVVASVDVPAHVDWHRGTQDRLGQIAARMEELVAALGVSGPERLERPRTRSPGVKVVDLSVVHSTVNHAREMLADIHEDLRAGLEPA